MDSCRCVRVDGTTLHLTTYVTCRLGRAVRRLVFHGTVCDVSVNARRTPGCLTTWRCSTLRIFRHPRQEEKRRGGGSERREYLDVEATVRARAHASVSSLAAAASLLALLALAVRVAFLSIFFFSRQRQPAIPAAAPPPRSCILRPCSARLHPHLEKRRAARKATDRPAAPLSRALPLRERRVKQRDTAAAAAESVARRPPTPCCGACVDVYVCACRLTRVCYCLIFFSPLRALGTSFCVC